MDAFDVFIIGGGINGCGIARDAAGRGYTVGLAEMNDLASGTSSWSTKLVHGGLRYLEHYEFRLVREALIEREVLWRIAPHVIRPLRFILPHRSGLRPWWLLRTGLFLYDHLGGRKDLPPTTTVDLAGPLGAPLKSHFVRGLEYSDARVDDSRLVILNARDARARGAKIMVRTKVIEARRFAQGWRVTLRNRAGATEEVSARLLVNAAGPWVDEALRGPLGRDDSRNIRLVQGSHIVTRKLFEHDRAYIFQNEDARIVFAIPYEDEFTLIGTTDRDYEGDPSDVSISESESEIDYLLSAAGAYLDRPVSRDDIVWTFAGVRPLFEDGASKAQEATRDYVVKVEGSNCEAALVNVFGGKITTYRKLAEEVMEIAGKRLGKRTAGEWTGSKSLPGGDFSFDGVNLLTERLRRAAPNLDRGTVTRLIRSYGTDAIRLAEASGGDLGRDLGHGLREAEVEWLVCHEWAETAEDVLWRRTKLGLRFTPQETAALAEHLQTLGKKAGYQESVA